MAVECRHPGGELRRSLKRQVGLTYRGFAEFVPGASPIVSEYIQRKRLKALGFTSSTDRLPAWKAEAFIFIDAQIDKLNSDEMKKKQRKQQRGTSRH